MTDPNIQFEVQHFTLCDGWINTWTIDEGTGPQPQAFASADAAQAEIAEFLGDIQAEIAAGERAADEGYSRDEFRIVEVTAREVASPCICE